MAVTGGFIQLHRKILEWEWFSDAITFRTFVYLLLSANFEPGNYKGKTIQRGQLITSLPKISSELQQTIQQTRTALKHLKSTGEITDEGTPQYRIITIVKYDMYQSPNRQSNRQLTGNQQTDQQTIQQQYNNINNNKNNNKENNNISCLFDQFWKAYPRKESKPTAKKAFEKIKPDEELLQKMLTAIERFKKTDQWQEDGGRFIPHPSTWLNQRRWEDEPMAAKQTTGKQKVLPAQDFDQRDYSGVDDEMRANLAKEMEVFKATGEVKV